MADNLQPLSQMQQTNTMNWSPSMIKKRDVFLKVCEEHSRFVTCFFDSGGMYGIYLSAHKIAPEEVVHLVRAAKKYYNLVVL